MRRYLILASAILATARFCSAGPCSGGSLTSYIALGMSGCTIGGNTLSDFQTLSGISGATPIATMDVSLTPIGGDLDPGFTAQVNMTASAGTILEALFTYKISGNSYTGSSILLANSSETGDGGVTDIQNYCAGGTFGPDGVSGCSGVAGTLLTLDGIQQNDQNSFGGASFLNVTDDFTLDGGLAGSATGGIITDQFTATAGTATPEPVSVALAGLGLAFVLGLELRRIQAGLFVR